MALFITKWLSLGPRIFKQDENLHANSGWRVWLLTLGLSNRTVIVDTDKKVIHIHDRLFWFFARHIKVPFKIIKAISYGYSDINSLGGLNMAHDAYDVYRVGLKLLGDNDDSHHLFRFMGDGSFVNDSIMPDWFFWPEYYFDASGTQDRQSRVFVELLAKITGKPVEPP